VPVSLNDTVDLIDQFMFGTLQGIMEGDFDMNTIVDKIQSTNFEDLMKDDLWYW